MFRGISTKTGEFVYGYYVKIDEKHYILEPKQFEVLDAGKRNVSLLDWLTEVKQEPNLNLDRKIIRNVHFGTFERK